MPVAARLLPCAICATGFHSAYAADTSGFPPAVVLGVLAHPELDVQCEEQARPSSSRES